MRKALRFVALTVATMVGGVLGVIALQGIAEARDSSFVGWLEVRSTFGTGSGCGTAIGQGDICADDAIEAGAAGFAGENGETFKNSTNGAWIMTGVGATNNEALAFNMETTANVVTLSSSTGVTALAGTINWINNGTSDGGWAIVAAANQACNTTCVTACAFGFDDGAADAETIVACTDAAADKCLCMGAT